MSDRFLLAGDIPAYPMHAFRPRPDGRMTLEGGKGSSAPPPDPRLVEAQIKSMGIQDDAIQRIIANADRMQPMQEEQLQLGLDATRTAQTQSAADREWMLGRRGQLTSLQDKLVQDANSFSAEDRGNQLAGQATGDVRQAFATQRGVTDRDMARMGVNPSDGRAAAMKNQTGIAEALGVAQAGTNAHTQARQEGYALTDRATNALAGYPAMGMQATQQTAGYGVAGLDLANKGLAGMNSGYGMAGQAAGQMGSNATGMYGAQANYKVQADKAAADADPFGSILGAGAKLGAAWIGSDRRLKEAIEPVGVDARTGLTLYEFNYIGDPDRRHVGVMADEVLKVDPEAVSTDHDGFMQVDYGRLGIEFKEVA